MNMNGFDFREQKIFQLRNLFETYGYSRYKMNKFEEYDLYAGNKDFLLSDSVITFTDFGGKLMALKPDVTLSIVKNSRDDADFLQKLYYNENVYRAEQGGNGFREMTQVGLECIGNVDDFCILEILTLAAQSLKAISSDCILGISHIGILSDVLTSIGISNDLLDAAFTYISQKNHHELNAFFSRCGVSERNISLMNQLLGSCGSPYVVLPDIRSLLSDVVDIQILDRLLDVLEVLRTRGLGDLFRFDFSEVDNIHYYNGIVFKGFVNGLPDSVLSGGQYDKLMRKMHRKSDAVGFAVYIDRLERLEPQNRQYDVDTVLLYDDTTSLKCVMDYAAQLRECGQGVMVQRQRPENVLCRQLIRLQSGEVEILEKNA